MKTRTQEQIKRGGELINALTALFQPYVEAILAPKIRTDMAAYVPQPVDMTEEDLKLIVGFMRAAAKEDLIPDEEAETLIKGAEEEFRNPKPFTPEEIENAVRVETQAECGQLVRTWLNVILFVALDGPVAASSIDDAMLPPLAGEEADAFDQSCNQMVLGRDGVLAVLRQVKATLSPGRPMPAEAIEFLQAEGVTLS